MAERRTLESPTEALCRQEKNRKHMATKRSLETPNETLCRQEKDQNTWLQNVHQRLQVKPYAKKKRNIWLNKEHWKAQEILYVDKKGIVITWQKKKTTTKVSIDNASSAFISKIKMGPDFVCTCHRMMYKQMVLQV